MSSLPRFRNLSLLMYLVKDFVQPQVPSHSTPFYIAQRAQPVYTSLFAAVFPWCCASQFRVFLPSLPDVVLRTRHAKSLTSYNSRVRSTLFSLPKQLPRRLLQYNRIDQKRVRTVLKQKKSFTKQGACGRSSFRPFARRGTGLRSIRPRAAFTFDVFVTVPVGPLQYCRPVQRYTRYTHVLFDSTET